MAILQTKDFFDSNDNVVNKGGTVPPWYSDDLATFKTKVQNHANWYGDSVPSDFFYNSVGNKLFIQYGQNVLEYASARFFNEEIEISNEVANVDGSVSADVKITVGFIGGTKAEHTTAGWSVVSKLNVGNTNVFTYTGNSMDTYFSDEHQTVTQHVTVQPSKDSNETILSWTSHYPNGERPDDSIKFGIILHNPTPPTYRPFAVFDGSKWVANNDSALKIQNFQDGSFKDFSLESLGTIEEVDKGHNRVFFNGNFKQASKMKGSEIL